MCRNYQEKRTVEEKSRKADSYEHVVLGLQNSVIEADWDLEVLDVV